jgi:hypothetical protein
VAAREPTSKVALPGSPGARRVSVEGRAGHMHEYARAGRMADARKRETWPLENGSRLIWDQRQSDSELVVRTGNGIQALIAPIVRLEVKRARQAREWPRAAIVAIESGAVIDLNAAWIVKCRGSARPRKQLQCEYKIAYGYVIVLRSAAARGRQPIRIQPQIPMIDPMYETRRDKSRNLLARRVFPVLRVSFAGYLPERT